MSPEWLLVLVPLAVVALSLGRTRGPGRLKAITLLLIVAGAASLGWLWTVQAARRAKSNEQLAERNPAQGRPDGYVSSDKCQSCHPSQYESWYRTYHRTMTQVAAPGRILGNFDNVRLQLEGKNFLLQRRGEEFWVEMDDPEAEVNPTINQLPLSKGRAAARVWKRIGLLTGSHHMQVYWIPIEAGNMQTVFPFAWLNEDQRWVPFHQTFLRDPATPPFPQTWNSNCINCHATAGQPRVDPQTRTMSTRVGELGIACEACHGPAQAHVAANQNPLRRYALHRQSEGDRTIINPKRLSPRLSSEACGQCHGIKWVFNGPDWQMNGFRFRPGEELDHATPLIRPAHLQTQPWLTEPLKNKPTFLADHYWPDGVVRVSGRDFNGLVESPCHQRGNLSCVSCHSMHHSDPSNQLAVGMESNEACLQCHTTMRQKIQEHTHHGVNSSGSLCYNCHMPYTVYGLLKGIRSHQIDSPNVKTTLATGRPDACNLCHLDRSLGWTASKLTEWYRHAPVKMSQDQQEISAAVLWLVQGDAGQRALIANSMGWKPARQASGEQWMAPYLSLLLIDPYSAVRYIAHRSLPGEYKKVPYDFVGSLAERTSASQQIFDLWQKTSAKAPGPVNPELLIGAEGAINENKLLQLRQHRNNRSMDLQE